MPAKIKKDKPIGKTSKKHVTFVIPPALDMCIEMYCAASGRQKNDVAAEAIREYLKPRQQEILNIFDSTMAAIKAL